MPYLDFNLCKDEYLNLGQESYIDVDHLNGKGAQELTTLLADLSAPLAEAQNAQETAGTDADPVQEFIDEYFNAWYD